MICRCIGGCTTFQPNSRKLFYSGVVVKGALSAILANRCRSTSTSSQISLSNRRPSWILANATSNERYLDELSVDTKLFLAFSRNIWTKRSLMCWSILVMARTFLKPYKPYKPYFRGVHVVIANVRHKRYGPDADRRLKYAWTPCWTRVHFLPQQHKVLIYSSNFIHWKMRV